MEKDERPLLYGEEKTAEKTAPPWCTTPLHTELYNGIYRKDVEARFFDTRSLGFDAQVTECVQAAVTSLALNRVRRFKEVQLDGGELEVAAIARMKNGKPVLALILNYESQRAQTTGAVCRAVVEAAVEIILLRGVGSAR